MSDPRGAPSVIPDLSNSPVTGVVYCRSALKTVCEEAHDIKSVTGSFGALAALSAAAADGAIETLFQRYPDAG